MDRMLRLALGSIRQARPAAADHIQRLGHQDRRWHRQACRRAHDHATGRARDPARSGAEARRSLHGRHVRGRARLDRGLPRPDRSTRTSCARARIGRGRATSCGYLQRRLQQYNPRDARAATSRITTTSTRGSIRSSSTPTGNIAAPISRPPGATLDDAQLAKKRHLAAKLLMHEPGQRVLDIGCGWGGLALYLAEITGARCHRHHAVAGAACSRASARERDRARASASSSACRITATSPNSSTASSRSACSSMSASATTMRSSATARDCSTDDGVMVLHSIGRSEGPSSTNPWIAKYIFPGGYIPALSEVLPAIERAGLLVTDIEILRLHYAETLKAWRERFLAHREEVERHLRRAFRADVGVLSRRVRNGVPRAEHDGVPDSSSPSGRASFRSRATTSPKRKHGCADWKRGAARRCGSPANSAISNSALRQGLPAPIRSRRGDHWGQLQTYCPHVRVRMYERLV